MEVAAGGTRADLSGLCSREWVLGLFDPRHRFDLFKVEVPQYGVMLVAYELLLRLLSEEGNRSSPPL